MAKKRLKVDKLVKGIIIGGAIGSVVGVTLAPKSGKETRSDLKKGASSLMRSTKKLPAAGKRVQKKKKGVLRTLVGGVRTLILGKKKS